MSGKVLEWSFHDEPRASSYGFEPAIDGVTVKKSKGHVQMWEYKAKFEMRLDPSTLIMDVLPMSAKEMEDWNMMAVTLGGTPYWYGWLEAVTDKGQKLRTGYYLIPRKEDGLTPISTPP